MSKTVVLLSGGQDSTTCLFWAKHRLLGAGELHTLSLYYGQRHAVELEAAHSISKLAGAASHVDMVVPALMGGSSALTDESRTIAADGGTADKEAPNGLPTTFVPGRNLLFLAIAAAHAAKIGASFIVTGVCQTDYSGYPDCRLEFIHRMQDAINAAWPSGGIVPQIRVPLMRLSKKETVDLAYDLAVAELASCVEGSEAMCGNVEQTKVWQALALSVTCYRGQRPGCGACPACQLRAKGFDEANVKDPARVRFNRITSETT